MMETGELFVVYRECDEDRSSEAAMGGGAQRPVLCVNDHKKTGARSARARTRGQNPLVYHIFIQGTLSVCVCVCVCVTICVGTLCYSFSFSNQTDQGNETEGLEMEGLEKEIYGKGQTGEGGCEYTYHCLSLN